jgi:hypothetical protein
VQFFLERLHEFLQVPVGCETGPIPDAKTSVQYECSVCKRPSLAGRETCWTCGSPVQAVLPTFDEPRPVQAGLDQPEGSLLDLDITSGSSSLFEETANANG